MGRRTGGEVGGTGWSKTAGTPSARGAGQGVAEAGGEKESSFRGAKQSGLVGWVQRPAHVVRGVQGREAKETAGGKEASIAENGTGTGCSDWQGSRGAFSPMTQLAPSLKGHLPQFCPPTCAYYPASLPMLPHPENPAQFRLPAPVGHMRRVVPPGMPLRPLHPGLPVLQRKP